MTSDTLRAGRGGGPRIALAACAEEPRLDEEGAALLRALAARGVAAEPAVWDDGAVDWAAYDLVVVRATWDYPLRRAQFLAWTEHVDAVSRLLNEPLLVRWTTDKAYLLRLAEAGVPVVPSWLVGPGSAPEHELLGVAHVVKPTVSAGSLDTLRLGPGEADRSVSHVRALQVSGRTALVQPYLDAVDTHGETAVVLIDGVVSHAIRKAALLGVGAGLVEGLYAQEEITAREASEAEVAVAGAALAAVPADAAPLYARVDLLHDASGPRVLEVELAEPSLFLQYADGAADRFAAAILARLG